MPADEDRTGAATVVQLGELMMILDLHRQGLSVTAIARRTGRDPKTIRKYIERGLELPVYRPAPGRPAEQACALPRLPPGARGGVPGSERRPLDARGARARLYWGLRGVTFADGVEVVSRQAQAVAA